MDDPLQLFSLLFMFCVCCGVPLLIAATVGYAFGIDVPRKKAALKDLAEQIGLRSIHDPRRGSRYAGMHQEHAFDIGLGVTRRTRPGPDRIHHRYSLALQIVVEVPANVLLRGYAGCNRYPGPHESFDVASGKARLGMEHLSPEARAAMMTFVRKHGYLWLEGLPLQHRPEQPPPPGKMRLEHTMIAGTHDQVTAVLDEMVVVARVIETTC